MYHLTGNVGSISRSFLSLVCYFIIRMFKILINENLVIYNLIIEIAC